MHQRCLVGMSNTEIDNLWEKLSSQLETLVINQSINLNVNSIIDKDTLDRSSFDLEVERNCRLGAKPQCNVIVEPQKNIYAGKNEC